MISNHHTPRRARMSRPVLLVVLAGLFLALLTYGGERISSAQECADGQVPSGNGVTCVADPSATPEPACPEGQELNGSGIVCVDITTGPDGLCPVGQQMDDIGLFCEDIPPEPEPDCPAGQELDVLGFNCVDIEGFEPDESALSSACDQGYSLGADGVTCIADGPSCERDEVLNDSGECQRTFQCPDGQFLASDLLTCYSDSCPDGELLSVDGRRCVAENSNCPDGTPRPEGGACLVVETIEAADGTTEVVVRCAEADSFCQARVKQCAEDRAAGADDAELECEDPRGACDEDDAACIASNDRLVECATRGLEGDDGEAVRIGSANDPCTDLCPTLHRLDISTGECVEFLDPKHPCVSFGRVPAGVTTNAQLDSYSYLAGLGQCVTRGEFLRRLGNFEAAAGAEADALTLLRETTSSYLTVEGQLAELDQLLLESEREIRRFTADAAEADRQRADNAKLLLFTQKQLLREQALLREEVLQVFVIGGNDALVEEAILSSTNVTEITVAQIYGDTVLTDQVAIVDRVGALEDQAESLGVALEQAAAEVEASLASAVMTSEALEILQAEAETLRAEQLLRRDEEAELVAELQENKAEFAQQLGVFEQATREISDIIADAEFRVTTFAEFDGLLANPILPETRISSGFGPRLHPILATCAITTASISAPDSARRSSPLGPASCRSHRSLAATATPS